MKMRLGIDEADLPPPLRPPRTPGSRYVAPARPRHALRALSGQAGWEEITR